MRHVTVLRESCNTDEEAASILPLGVSVAPLRMGVILERWNIWVRLTQADISAQERDLRT